MKLSKCCNSKVWECKDGYVCQRCKKTCNTIEQPEQDEEPELKVGSVILVEQALENSRGEYIDEYAKVLSIDNLGFMKLEWPTRELNHFLKDCEYRVDEYKHCVVNEILFKPEQNEGIDMGESSTCNVCNKRYCTCPERQPNGSWVKQDDFIEEKIDRTKMAIHHILQKEIADKVWYQDKGCEIQLKKGLDEAEKEIVKVLLQQKEAIEKGYKMKVISGITELESSLQGKMAYDAVIKIKELLK